MKYGKIKYPWIFYLLNDKAKLYNGIPMMNSYIVWKFIRGMERWAYKIDTNGITQYNVI